MTQFEVAINSIPALVWTAMPDGYVDFLNQRWQDYTGLELEVARGWGWQAAIHPDDRPGLLEYWRGLLTSRRSSEFEARRRRVDGEYRWFSLRAESVLDAAGEVEKCTVQ